MSPTPEDQKLEEGSYQSLLELLDSDREVAEQRLTELRAGLVRLATFKYGYSDPEDLANRVLDRFARNCAEGLVRAEKEIYGYLRNIFLELVDKPTREVPLSELLAAPEPDLEDQQQKKLELDCLDQCLERLRPKERQLILEYHRYDKRAKIVRRRELAEERDWNLNQLRINTCRLRTKLRQCHAECMSRQASE